MGATPQMQQRLFQSTLPRGSDGALSNSASRHAIFQSTLPRGSDQVTLRTSIVRANFNPRSLTGATVFGERKL